MWHDKIQISRKCGKPVSKTRQREHRQCWAQSGVINTQIGLCPPTHLWVKKKTSLVNFKQKITTSANYKDVIGLTTKKYVCMVKDFKTTSKSIHQIRPVLMPWWNVWGGGGKKQWIFPSKTIYKLGTDEKRGEQVGFCSTVCTLSVINCRKYQNFWKQCISLEHKCCGASFSSSFNVKKFFFIPRCRCPRCGDPTEFGTNTSGLPCGSCPGLLLPQV